MTVMFKSFWRVTRSLPALLFNSGLACSFIFFKAYSPSTICILMFKVPLLEAVKFNCASNLSICLVIGLVFLPLTRIAGLFGFQAAVWLSDLHLSCCFVFLFFLPLVFKQVLFTVPFFPLFFWLVGYAFFYVLLVVALDKGWLIKGWHRWALFLFLANTRT